LDNITYGSSITLEDIKNAGWKKPKLEKGVGSYRRYVAIEAMSSYFTSS